MTIAITVMLFVFGSSVFALAMGRLFAVCDPQRMEPVDPDWSALRSYNAMTQDHADMLDAIDAGGPLDPDTMDQIIASHAHSTTNSGSQQHG